MLGIIKKDLISVRSTLVSVPICALIIILIPIILNQIPDISNTPIVAVFPIMLLVFPIMASGVGTDIITSDKSSSFIIYQRTLPVSPQKIMLGHTLTSLILNVFITVLVITAYIVYDITGLMSFNPDFLLLLALTSIVGIVMFQTSYALFVVTDNMIFSIIGMLLPFAAIIFPLVIYCRDDDPAVMFENFSSFAAMAKENVLLYFAVVIVVGGIISFVSFKASVAATRRASTVLKGMTL